jgi:hypothetical protein
MTRRSPSCSSLDTVVPPRVPQLLNLRSDPLDAIDNRRGTTGIADRTHET